MDQSKERPTGFYGTYFDRDAVLKIARAANIIAWILLAFYVYITLVSVGQYLSLVVSGMITFENMTFFDRLSIPTLQLTQLAPGLVYFILLKIAQQALLILLDMEDNSRRAARRQ
jgi:hypothetical protein